MGKRGPKPTPTKILKLRNSWRGKARGGEPSLDQRRPQRPQWLKGESRKAWDRIMPLLHRAGLATRANRETLACLCDSWGRYVEACQECDAAGMVLENTFGNMVQNPWVAIRNKMWDQIYKGAAAFGMTPADLSSVRAVDKPADDVEKTKFFKGAG